MTLPTSIIAYDRIRSIFCDRKAERQIAPKETNGKSLRSLSSTTAVQRRKAALEADKMTEVKLSEQQVKVAKDVFKSFDKKNEDRIKVGDIEAVLKKLGHNIKPDWLEKIESTIDTEGTGYVHFDEFCKIVRKKVQDDEDERELKEMFRILDKEKRGEVNADELRWILKNLGEDLTENDIDDMIADVDTDGSGWVDYDEFYKLMMSD